MNAGTVTLPVVDTGYLESISELPTELAIRQAAPFLVRLVEDPAFFEGEIRPLLEEARGAAGDWYVARSYGGKDHIYSLQVFIWPPSSETKIHDHSSWGVYCCAVGTVLEKRYERLDDGSRLDHARLKEFRRRMWSKEDGASSVLPHDGGIHRVGNPGDDRRSRCTCTDLGWGRWTVGTTTPLATTSVTAAKTRQALSNRLYTNFISSTNVCPRI